MPVSTVLADTARYLLKEDPVFMFPDDHIDVIQAYVNFLYEGYFLITETVTEDKVLNFMNRTGLILPPGSFQVLSLILTKCFYSIPIPNAIN